MEIAWIKSDEQIDNSIVFLPKIEDIDSLKLTAKKSDLLSESLLKKETFGVNHFSENTFYIQPKANKNKSEIRENFRKLGSEAFSFFSKATCSKIKIIENQVSEEQIFDFIEGFLLSNYQFENYKTERNTSSISLLIQENEGREQKIVELKNLCNNVFLCRDWVNMPPNKLTTDSYVQIIEKTCQQKKLDYQILTKDELIAQGFGGLLAVNAGSSQAPYFVEITYKAENAFNPKPIILIGKGIVYDTGGLSIKPTPGSMDIMKCDMAGSATVIAATFAMEENKLPVYCKTLIPLTDNHISNTAFLPGDVITMHNKMTVEVLNTDAEGRMILADALSYAQQFDPLLCLDFATLTGSALRAIGHEGAVYYTTAESTHNYLLEKAAEQTFERLVRFPLWKDYKDYLTSDIADLKNIGGDTAGSITAAKFLECFVNYPWMHFDIAGPAFLPKNDAYRTKNGSGYGVRLVYNFIKELALQHGK